MTGKKKGRPKEGWRVLEKGDDKTVKGKLEIKL